MTVTVAPPTAEELAMSTGLNPNAVAEIMSTMRTCVGALRSDWPGIRESDLASVWRNEFGPDELFTDERAFLVLAGVACGHMEAAGAVDDPGHRRIVLQSMTAFGDLPRVPAIAQEFTQVARERTRTNGLPWPEGDPQFAQALLRCGGACTRVADSRSLDLAVDDQLSLMVMFVLAAHALNSPPRIWTALCPAEPEQVTASGPVEVSDHPTEVVKMLTGLEIQLKTALWQAEERVRDLRGRDPGVMSALENQRLDGVLRAALESVGINLEPLADLLRHQDEYKRAGFLRQISLGNASGRIHVEFARLARLWAQALSGAQHDVIVATAARKQKLGELTNHVERFTTRSGYALALPPQGFLGPVPGKDGQGSLWLHTQWLVRPVVDRDWTLPCLAVGDTPVAIVSNTSSLPYEQAVRGARDIVLAKMTYASPRGLVLTWLDPIGRGQSAGPFLDLLETDKSLIDEKVWSEPDEITEALRRVTERMSYLEQRCLKDTFDDLSAYNDQAGALAEPRHAVVVTGFPRGFTEESAARLRQISEQGARLGVSVIVVCDPLAARSITVETNPADGFGRMLVTTSASGLPSWWSPETVPKAHWLIGHGSGVSVPVILPGNQGTALVPGGFLGVPADAAARIVAGCASASEHAAEVVVASDALVVSGGSSAEALELPLGVHGRGTPVRLSLGKGLSQNVLVGGLPGSGKSTLFHTMITVAARSYSPTELEMYLLDFKQGVEFQPYADGALPHARVVAVQSERDFGLSVLRGLRDEIDSRSTLFRGVGADSLTEYRRRTGAQLPRVLVVVDEFQVLFADDDNIAHECAQLLDHVVRQGRAFGLHTVLGTQTLRGQGTMSLLRGTLDQVAIRIVLKTGEADSRLFLADDNPAGSRLTRPGEAIFNADSGRPEGNLAFQVALTSDESRDQSVAGMRLEADQMGFTRRPLVFDGARKISAGEDEAVAGWLSGATPARERGIALHVGMPVAIGGSGAAVFSRSGGRNLLIVLRDEAMRGGAALVAVVTAVRSSATTPRVDIIECAGDDEPHAFALRDLAGWRGAVTWGRRRKALSPVLAEAAAEVRRRVEEDDYSAQPWIIVLNTLQRARELTGVPAFDESDPQSDLEAVLTDGSDVGVHLVVTADSVETVERRLGHAALASFGARLLGQCSADTSHKVIGSAAASRLGPAYALLDEPDDNRCETVRPFPLPDAEWVAAATRD